MKLKSVKKLARKEPERKGLKKGLTTRTKVIISVVSLLIAGVVIFYDFSGGKAITVLIESQYSVHDPEFARTMNVLLGPQLMQGNRIETLINGVQIFPSMLEAIKGARRSITMETYIYWSGEIAKKVTNAICERSKAGVKVHVLMDWMGSDKIQSKLFDQMKAARVQVERFHPAPWFTFSNANNRTHRKILVIDGKIGFTGGVGFADIWEGNADNPKHWRDSHFRFEGPVVAEMESVFVDHWIATTGKVLQGDDYFPSLNAVGNQTAQVFKSSPENGSESARLMFLYSIASARKSIMMSNAYFVPDDLSIQTFVAAARRGVKIRIIAPGKNTDTKFVRHASRSRLGKLLEAGVEFYEYQPTMFHCKVMVVDGLWSSVGSTNFDNRSFRLNDEVNLNILDEGFARKQEEVFREDLKRSHRVTYEEWKSRPFFEKLIEKAAGLLRHQV